MAQISADTLTQVASIVAGFGVTALMFRLQRELKISGENSKTPTWFTLADFLVLGAVLIALLGVVLPLLISSPTDSVAVPKALCEVAIVLLAGYTLCILAHYRFIFGLHYSRSYFMFWETVLFVVTVCVAAWLGYRLAMSA